MVSDSWQHIGQLQQVYHCLLCEFVDVCCIADCVLLFSGFTSRFVTITIDTCGYNVFMNIATGIQVATKSFILTNPALICGTRGAALVLEAMSVNATSCGALSNFIKNKHLSLCSEV